MIVSLDVYQSRTNGPHHLCLFAIEDLLLEQATLFFQHRDKQNLYQLLSVPFA
jgi:hypothetical protein